MLALLKDTENIKAEPSPCSSLFGPVLVEKEGIHICWLTGEIFVPGEIFNEIYNKAKNLLNL